MLKLIKQPRHLMSIGLLSVLGSLAIPAQAHAFDMDCKVILCIAGGFPSTCGDAYSYMIKRITKFPKPLPPFGFCAMSNGSEYKGHDVSYRYLHNGPEAYDGLDVFTNSLNVLRESPCYIRAFAESLI